LQKENLVEAIEAHCR